MKRPNSSRYTGTDGDNVTYNSNISASDNFLSLVDDRKNNKTEQIKLIRNLLQSSFQVRNMNDDASWQANCALDEGIVDSQNTAGSRFSYSKVVELKKTLKNTDNANVKLVFDNTDKPESCVLSDVEFDFEVIK